MWAVVAVQAVETSFRMLMTRGLIRPLPNGEIIMFSVVSAVYLYLFRKVINHVVGQQVNVAAMALKAFDLLTRRLSYRVPHHHQTPIPARQEAWLAWLNTITVSTMFRTFGLGYVIQLLVNVTSLRMASKDRSRTIFKLLWKPGCCNLAWFLTLYSSLFKAVNCLLRWVRRKDEACHGMVAGFLAGCSSYFYKSSTIALFSASKLAELLYFKGVESGILPHLPRADIILYAISTAFIFHTAVMEPHSLRPAYWKWLLRVTHNKLGLMNRKLLDGFGCNSSKLFPDYWPDYDPSYTSLVRPSRD